MTLNLRSKELALLECFNCLRVRYLLIGVHAVQHHGQVRIGKDLGVLLDTFGGNPQRVFQALSDLRLLTPILTAERLSLPNQRFRIGEGCYMELLTSLNGFDFHEGYERRVMAVEQGIALDMVSVQDLSVLKEALNQPFDMVGSRAAQ